MKLHIFQSDKGDCLLLEAQDNTLVLCDGGMQASMKAHVRDELAKLRAANREITYAYVSHIDSDHISGILQLLEDEAAWRVYDHHQKQGDTAVRKPKVPRPPVIRGLLHNAFRDQINDSSDDIEKMLAASAPALFATAEPQLMAASIEMQNIATSIPEALKVSRLAAADALKIPVNRLPGQQGPAKLLFFRDKPKSFAVGSMKFTLVGPGKKELEDLRQGWINWLRENRERVVKLRSELKRRVEEFGTAANAVSPFDLRDWNGIPDYKGVTTPNVASLMFLVEEGKKRLLLTGDSQQDKILDGLQRAGFLKNGYVHLDVLKVQHHGSENNMDANFARQVSADHYVFCGNGEHGNPSPDVINCVFESRLGKPGVRALAPHAKGRPFTFWFSTTSDEQASGSPSRKAFAEVERLVAKHVNASGGLMTAQYNQAASIPLDI